MEKRVEHYQRSAESEDERRLADAAKQGAVDSLNPLIEAHLAFVATIAKQYRSLGLSYEDLLSEGNLGLIQAARRYDASRGIRFGSYAGFWIRKAILEALNQHSKLIRPSSHQTKNLRQIRDTENALRKTLGRTPAREEISVRLSRTVAHVEKALRLNHHEVALDEVLRDDHSPVVENLIDRSCDDPEETLLQLEKSGLVTEVMNALSELSERQRLVISYRFGLDDEPPRSLREVGKRLRISCERVRQIECDAKARIRNVLRRKRLIAGPRKLRPVRHT